MNFATETAAEPESGIHFVNFNQDYSMLAIASKFGYKIISLKSDNHFDTIFESEMKDVYIVEQLFNSSLLAMVSSSSRRKLIIFHFRKGIVINNYNYSNTILAVKLNRTRLVVCLEELLYIHNIKNMKLLYTIHDTPPNLTGLCTLSISNDNCYLAYPGSNTIGAVQIFDTVSLQLKIMIPAHESPLAALAFNPSGTKVATASEKGTIIRVFNVHDGTKLVEFRRGVKRCVTISCLGFSTDSKFLCCSSNTETVHIFKLEEPTEVPQQEPEGTQSWMIQSWIGYLTKAVSASASYLPSQVTDVFSQGRAFISVHLPFQGLKNVCAITSIEKVLRLLVATADGYLYIYNLDIREGGNCTLLRQHRLDGKQDEEGCASFADEACSGDASVPTDAQAVQNTGTIFCNAMT